MASSRDDALAKVRAICTAFPEVTERPSHGAPSWFVRDQKTFVTCWFNGHHDLQFPHLWCAAPAGTDSPAVASPDPPIAGVWAGRLEAGSAGSETVAVGHAT